MRSLEKISEPVRPAEGNIDEFRFIDAMVRNADPGGTRVVPAGTRLVVRGWMFAPNPPRVPVSVTASVSGRAFDLVQARPPRPDIAASFNNPELVTSGYYGVLSLEGMTPGKYEVRIGGTCADGVKVELPTHSEFEIVPSRMAFPAVAKPAETDSIRVTVDEFSTFGGRARSESGTLPVDLGDVVNVRGWAVDTALRRPVSAVFAVIDGRDFVMGVHGLVREDIAPGLSSFIAESRRCGFVVRLKTRHLLPGIHTVAIRVVDAEGATYATADAGRFIIRGANGTSAESGA